MTIKVNKWVINHFSCSIPYQIQGVKQYLVINLNKAKLFSHQAMYLNKFDELEGRNAVIGMYVSLFYHVIECCAKKYNEIIEKPDEKNKKKKKTQKKKKGKKTRRGQTNPTFFDDDEAVEDSDADEDESNRNGEDEDMEDNDQDQDLEWDKEGPMIDVFCECVLKDGNTVRLGEQGWRAQVTDYRFWLVNYSDKKFIDFNVIGHEIYREILYEHEKILKKRMSGRGIEGVPAFREYERWKLMNTKRTWAEVMDSYVGRYYAMQQLGAVEQKMLSDEDNPVCLTNFFNAFWAFYLTDKSADSQQSQWNYSGYLKLGDDGTYTISFPYRKFVYRVPQSDMKASILYNRIMQDQQQVTINQFVKMLPLILKDPQLYKDKSAEDMKEDFMNEKNPLTTNYDSGIVIGGEDSMDIVDDSLSISRRDNMKNMMKFCKVKNFDLNAKRNDENGLIMTTQSQLLDFFMSAPGLHAMYASAYTSIMVSSKRNIDKIRMDISSAESNGGYWRQLKNPLLVARKLYTLNQEKVFREYADTCRSVDSNLSPSGKKIMEYVSKEGLYTEKREPHLKFDKRLSNFANMEIRRYSEWEQVYLVNHAHMYMNLTHKYSLDAYCMNFNRVHQNFLTHGEKGNESKSYLWKVLADHIRIQRTTEILQYESLKARATDDANMNDNIVIFDEMEQSIFDSYGSNDKERMIKQLLATNKVCAKVLHITEDGRRVTKVTYSECITVFFGSTNSDLACMSPPMRRRWHIAHFDERMGLNRAIIELELAGLILSETEKASRKKLDKEHHLIQAIVFEFEKLTYCKVRYNQYL